MPAAELPDDLRQWPADPFALLGVSRGAADTEVKRAYVRLIKRFKPEHHPEQFRRIRDAYETCLVQTAWHRSDSAESADEPVIESARSEPPEPTPAPKPVADELEIRTAGDPPAQEPSAEPSPIIWPDSVGECWNRLLDGPDPEAFAGLLAAAETEPDRADLSLRLYWLIAFHSDLDPGRTRHHWLARALRQSRFRGPALELYRRELEVDPAVALDGPYRDLFADTPPFSDVQGIALARIAAAGRAGLLGCLADDLASLRRHLQDSPEAWLGVLVAAHDWAAWTRGNRAADRIAEELAGLKYLELRHSWSFDRIDEVRAMVSAVRGFNLPPAVIALVRSWMATGGSPTSAEVEAAAAAVVDGATKAFGMTAISRELLTLASRAFEAYLRRRGEEDTEYPEPLIRFAAQRVWRQALYGYASWRRNLMDFLIEERIDPRDFAMVAKNENDAGRRALAKNVAADEELRAVWLAIRIVEG